mmetsp:Transcript_22246/g.40085  ORF Transcript_22246/g.40085 Transcript_22246/m.40085 type:complete len:158 (-) Transcript_22246:32-505(-)
MATRRLLPLAILVALLSGAAFVSGPRLVHRRPHVERYLPWPFSLISGVTKETLESGDGQNFPKPGDTVYMTYTGSLTGSNKVFDSSGRMPFSTKIGVGQVIKGWDEGVPQMSLGEKAKLIITSDYGYGERGAPPDIPPNAGLTFEVKLMRINDLYAR